MSKFIKLDMSKPSGARFINLDCVMAVAVGENNTAKLYMANGDEYETFCSYTESLELAGLTGSSSTANVIGLVPDTGDIPLPY